MRKDRGIITIATGHYLYGRMAYALAATVKAYTDLPVCVLADEEALSHLTKEHRAVFDEIIFIQDGGVASKYDLQKLSPFSKTIYLDADTIITSPKIEALFSELDSVHFTSTNEGYYDVDKGEDKSNRKYLWWADIRETTKLYGLKGKVYQLRSEFMYFDKSKEAKKLFDTAKKIAAAPKLKTTTFAGGIPDEFSFQIAANMLGMQPHIEGFQPLWWFHLHRHVSPSIYELREAYYGVSLGGNSGFNDSVKYLYQNICESSCQILGLPKPFGLLAKKLVIPSRAHI